MKKNRIDKAEITKRAKEQIIILDGAMGTELKKRGMPEGVCPEAWCIKNPDVVKQVHADYIAAGSNLIYTATFGGNYFKLQQYGETDVVGINRKLAEIACKAAGDNIIVAGDIAPFGKFVEPFGEIHFKDAVKFAKMQIQGLLEGGVNAFAIETMMDIQEARAILIAIKESCDLFTLVTMTYEKSGHTLNGTQPQAALVTLQSLGADAVGCNCSSGPAEMLELVKCMQPLAKIPLVAKPNAGMPQLVEGKTVFQMNPDEFASYAGSFAAAGAAFVGGCCGTTPEHIKALSVALATTVPEKSNLQVPVALSSSRKAVVLKTNDPLHIIGERINPTGKKKLQQALIDNQWYEPVRLAREQQQNGAVLLDVNAGMPGINEKQVLCELVKQLSVKSELPLVLDSSDPETLAAALRMYPGRALINSVSAEKEKLEKLLPVAAKYGAMCIALPIEGRDIPFVAEERISIVEKIIAAAEKQGLSKNDLVVDGLVMAAASSPGAPAETLKTIQYCTVRLGVKTVIGLSNVSFGMPSRVLVNTAFLAQAVAAGLTFAIANPAEQRLREIMLASSFLDGRNDATTEFIAAYGENKAVRTETAKTETAMLPGERIKKAIIDGSKDEIIACIKFGLDKGMLPLNIVNEFMIPAINLVGELFAGKKYFLPQLLSSAETMEEGVRFLQPLLAKEEQNKEGKILLATVEGDIHDIGKNIVGLLLKNHGFEVIDLGKDVSAQNIIDIAKKEKPDIIGLSALMTTTMIKMQEVKDLAEKENIKAGFLLGGAVVSREYANSIDAFYAKDGVEAVSTARKIIADKAIR
ncbi:MAG: homocysteine S-methyltransferase family protein [Spirochaetales bacterium]|nr:homocysteine S-methyltransferase family protein [Spirochaetales bacterium]